MAEKATCPGCNSHTSALRMADEQGEPCPYCGLSYSARQEVMATRRRVADEELKAQLEAAQLRAGKAEAEVARLGRIVERVRWALEGDEPE